MHFASARKKPLKPTLVMNYVLSFWKVKHQKSNITYITQNINFINKYQYFYPYNVCKMMIIDLYGNKENLDFILFCSIMIEKYSCYHNGFCHYPLTYFVCDNCVQHQICKLHAWRKAWRKKSIPDNIYHKLVFDLDNFNINNINGWFEAPFSQIYFRSTESKVYKNKESDEKLI